MLWPTPLLVGGMEVDEDNEIKKATATYTSIGLADSHKIAKRHRITQQDGYRILRDIKANMKQLFKGEWSLSLSLP